MLDWLRARGSELDSWVASEAQRRAASNRAAGVARNVTLTRNAVSDADRKKVIEYITRGFSPGEGEPVPGIGLEDQILQQLQTMKGRQQVAKQYAPTMRRGQGGWAGRGAMEMINQGIAENAVVRRGVLPTAIGGGVVLGGAGMTASAQQLIALMDYMGASQRTEAEAGQPLTS